MLFLLSFLLIFLGSIQYDFSIGVCSTEALKGMEKVAEHINEMQRIHEEYGAIFDHLFRQHQKSCKQPIDLSPGNKHGLFYQSIMIKFYIMIDDNGILLLLFLTLKVIYCTTEAWSG